MLWIDVSVHAAHLAVVEAANLCHLAITANVQLLAGDAHALTLGNHCVKTYVVHTNDHCACGVVDDELLVYVAALVIGNDNAFNDNLFGNLLNRVTGDG